MSSAAHIAERLRAHARLYGHMAEQAWSEDLALEFRRMADECNRSAVECARSGHDLGLQVPTDAAPQHLR